MKFNAKNILKINKFRNQSNNIIENYNLLNEENNNNNNLNNTNNNNQDIYNSIFYPKPAPEPITLIKSFQVSLLI